MKSEPAAAIEVVAAERHHAPQPASETAKPAAPNRDPHGDPDTQRYVARLSQAERVAELRVDEVVARLAVAEDAVVGDLGCGPGVSPSRSRARRGGLRPRETWSPASSTRCAPRPGPGRPQRRARAGLPADPHFLPGRLDLVFVGDTYHHLRDRIAYSRRLQGVLAPGGRLAILEYKPGNLLVGPAEDHKLPPGVREAELAEAGYALVERFDTHQYHDFEVWRVNPGEVTRNRAAVLMLVRAMSSYQVTKYTVQQVPGDDQIEVVIHASDGNKWEYGIPFSRSTGRYMFEEIDVIANDFGDEFAEELTAKIEATVDAIVGR